MIQHKMSAHHQERAYRRHRQAISAALEDFLGRDQESAVGHAGNSAGLLD